MPCPPNGGKTCAASPMSIVFLENHLLTTFVSKVNGLHRMTLIQSRGNSILVFRSFLENLEPDRTSHGPRCFHKSASTSSKVSSGSTLYSCLQYPPPGGPNLPLTDGRFESLQKLSCQLVFGRSRAAYTHWKCRGQKISFTSRGVYPRFQRGKSGCDSGVGFVM